MKERLLVEVADIDYGFAFNSKNFNNTGDGLPLVRIRDVLPGFSETYFHGTFDSRYLVDDSDCLIGMDGRFNLGKWRGGKALLNQRVCRVRAKTDVVDQRYLEFYLPTALRAIEAETPFVTVKHLSAKRLAAIEVPCPSLEEQRRIAAILEKADAIRTKRRQALDLLEAVISSEFVRRFGSPVRDDRWSRRAIGDFAETRLGKMLDKKKQNDGEVFPYLRNVNVQWFSIDLDDVLEMKFSEREREILELRDGDILMCEGGEPGRCAVWRSSKKDIYFQKALHRIRLSEDVLPEYFVYCMRFMVEEGGLRDFVTSATIAHLTGEKLRTVQIPVPPVEEQMAFCQAANRAEQARKMVTDDAVRIDALFASLQSRAFKGEL